MRPLLLANCTVVDARVGDGAVPLRDAAVLVVDGVIAAVDDYLVLARTADDIAGGSGGIGPVTEVDLGGGFLTPGLINMHTHFSLALPGPVGDRVAALGPHDLALHMADGARRTLLGGVTTVRCVAERDHADFALRRAVETGRAAGPRIFTAGRALTATGGHGHEGSDTLECDGVEGFRRGVRAQRAAGADLIKVMLSGGIAGEHEQVGTRQLFADEIAAVMDTAHAGGLKVTAHAGPADVIGEAVALGLDCVEHGYRLTADVAAAMSAAGTALVPTLLVTRCEAFLDELGTPEWMRQRSSGAGPGHLHSAELARDAGVDILLGSDMPPFWSFEGTDATVRELEHLGDLLGPARALHAATRGPARWLGADHRVGTVEVGMAADLICVTDDPLESASAFRGIRWVMSRGEIVRDDHAGLRGTRPAVGV